MSKKIKFLVLLLLFSFVGTPCKAKQYPYRWVFVDNWLHKESDVEDIKSIANTASEHGLNGIVFWGGLDRLSLRPKSYLRRLEEVKQICEKHNLEIIPQVFSAGMGGSILSHNKNLAAGLPVNDALFVVENGKAHLVPDHPVKIVNGGFEQYYGNRFNGYSLHDKPGQVSFADKELFNSGSASLRFENFGKYRYGHARVMQKVKVHPHRCYKLSCWFKTENLKPGGSLKIQVYSPDGRAIHKWTPAIPSTADWQNITTGFNSLEYSEVKIYVGLQHGKSGKFWVDDLAIKEVGLLNVLRRPGTPVTVKSDETGLVYEEGKDFATIKDTKLNFRFDHEPPAIKVLPTSRIKNGERLRVSYYHGMRTVKKWQAGVCMSEPEIYEIWAEQAKLIHKHLAPNKYMLSMDEIRTGGSCQACKNRNMTMAQILGDCITRQVRIIREVNPKAEVFIWSDMLDPEHHAHEKYCLVEGSFTDSWKYIPKDLIMLCWYYKKRNESLRFFSSRGFRTMASACCDRGTLDVAKGWLKALEHTPKSCGIMYTTWKSDYELLAPFGDIVAGQENQK